MKTKTTNKQNRVKRTLEGILATVALATAFIPAAASTGFGGITASAGYVTDWSAEKDEIDDYFEDEFNFDTNNYFNSIVQDENTSKQQLVTNPDGTVSVIQKKKSEDNLTFRAFGVANADANVIYPGALLKANEALVTGNPEPIKIGRRDINISIPNAKMKDGCPTYVTVNPANASVVNDGITSKLVGNFRDDSDCTAQLTSKIVKVESEDQIKAKMNFSEEMWANLKVTASADYQNKKQAVVVDISQIFYTVAADAQTSADLFPDGMKLSRIQKYITPDSPAVMVSSVDYGKRVVAFIETSDMSFDLQATVEASGLGGKVKGGAEASYGTKLKNCSVNLFIAGGKSESAGKYFKNCSIDTLIEAAADNTKYDGHAVPVSYTTRWAHNGTIATAKYFGYTWETSTVKELTKTTPAKIKFNRIDRDLIRVLDVKVYGKRIQSFDQNGVAVLGEEELICDYASDFNKDIDFKLDADVAKDSVRIVVDYIGSAADRQSEATRTVYLTELARKTDEVKIGDVKKATAEDIENLEITFYEYAGRVNSQVNAKLTKDFGSKVNSDYLVLCKAGKTGTAF